MDDNRSIEIAAEKLVAMRGGEIIVGPLDFRLASGQALVLTGPNGVGKSTLLRIVAGLLPPGAGRIDVVGAADRDGEPVRHIREICHYLGHRNAMKLNVPVAENLRFWRRFLSNGGGSRAPDAEEALSLVGLAGLFHLPFGYLSAGQQRRAAIARLLVAPRPVWILDEPTAALDAASQARFSSIMRDHLAGGGIVFAATHQPLGLEAAREMRLERAPAPAEADLGAGIWL